MLSCEDIRVALSAQLDEEPPGLPTDILNTHLAHCADCRAFLERASRLRVPTSPLIDSPSPRPELTDAILAGVEPEFTRRARNRALGRSLTGIALVALGIAYLAWGIAMLVDSASLFGADADPRLSTYLAQATAFRFALGAALFFAAWQTRVVIGLLPLVGSLFMFTFGFTMRDLILETATWAHAAHLALLLLTVVVLLASWLTNFGLEGFSRTWKELSAQPF